MLDLQHTTAALGWLRDLSNPPDTSPATAAGREWLQRLDAEMTDARATGPELVAAAREMARAGGFFPTPGAIAERIRERRLAAIREERETAWRDQLGNGAAIEGKAWARDSEAGDFVRGTMEGFRNRNQREFLRRVVDLVRRGHPGPSADCEETLVAAVLREEREEDEARARGEQYRRRRYGPSGIPAEAAGLQPIGGGLR